MSDVGLMMACGGGKSLSLLVPDINMDVWFNTC